MATPVRSLVWLGRVSSLSGLAQSRAPRRRNVFSLPARPPHARAAALPRLAPSRVLQRHLRQALAVHGIALVAVDELPEGQAAVAAERHLVAVDGLVRTRGGGAGGQLRGSSPRERAARL